MFSSQTFLATFQHPDDEQGEVLARIAEYQAHQEDLQENYLSGQRINADQDLQTVFECIESIS